MCGVWHLVKLFMVWHYPRSTRFGAPTFFVSKAGQGGGGDEAEEMFFGSDRFDVMCDMFDLPWAGPDPSKAKL